MSLQQWLKNTWLKSHQTTPEEIGKLWAMVDRNLADAASDTISVDNQYNLAYRAALMLCAILLQAEGYVSGKGQGSHIRPINALPLILGEAHRQNADYLDGCRGKRNRLEYEYVGATTSDDVAALLEYAHELRTTVLAWLKEKHPELAPPE
jgi:hypothetical protein